MNGSDGDHGHPETLGGDGDAGGDAAEADQSERRAVELERIGGHRAGRPGGSAGLQHRQVLGDGEHQRHRVLGGRHGRGLRGVARDDAGGGDVGEVHVVVADAGPRDHAEPWARREHRCVIRALAAGDRAVGEGEVGIVGADGDRAALDQVAEDGRESRRRRRAPEAPCRPSSADRSARPIRQRCSGSVAGRRPFLFPMSDEQLDRYRASIDNIDAALVHLLAERFKITQAVGEYKAQVGLPPADLEREAEQIARLRALAVESGLDPAFTEKFLRFIVAEVIHHHQRLSEPDAD